MRKFLLDNRTCLITLLMLVVGVLLMVMPDFALAQTPNTGSREDLRPTASMIGPLDRLGSMVGNFILYIGAYFTWFGGMLLTTSIELFVLNIGTYLATGQPIGNAINAVWALIRDICNLAFIFGFIYVGIRTIIDYESASTKRFLASIIIGALLINFSLFFAKVIIDVGNIIAVETYNTLTTGTGDISAQFADILGVTTLYKLPDPKEYAARTAGANIAYYFMGTVMLIVAGFVLAAGAVLLMIRFVALILILCFSPILFAATVFPQTQSVASDLWKKLINYSLFAPAYLLLLLVSIYILSGVVTALRGDSSLSCALNNENTTAACAAAGGFSVVLSFGVGIFFLIMSLQIASKLGVVGGDKAISIGNSLRGKVQSFAGRTTVGRGAAGLLKGYDKLDSKAANTKGWRGAALKTIRGTAVVAAGGERNLRGGLESVKKSKFGGSYSHADDKEYSKEQKKRRAETHEQGKFKAAINPLNMEGVGELTKEEREKAQQNKQIEMERAVADASTKYLEDLTQKQRLDLVKYMTQAQIDALGKSDNVTESEMSELNAKRAEIFKEEFGAKHAVPDSPEAQKLRDSISKANIDQLMAVGPEFLMEKNNIIRITASQMDELKKKLTPTEYKRLSDKRDETLKELVASAEGIDGKTAHNHILRMKASDMSKLPKDVLTKLAPQLPVSTLNEIKRQNTLSAEDQRALVEAMDVDLAAIPIPEGVDGAEFVSKLADRQNAVKEWLDKSPVGQEFGK